MAEDVDWERFADPTIISARTLISIILIIEVIIQSLSLMIAPTDWWTWQLLGFIAATNLGAVVLAVLAQQSANDIGKAYKTVFTPSFYKTVFLISQFQEFFESEATKEGRNIDEEIREVAPKLWGLMRAKLDVSDELPTLIALVKEQDDDLFE